ncbi:unnamed protein product [Amoebophrya sp. A25]|nr:unnamed protein product [Amoebophrya sp. A25]|eukprot:GSA25T00003698001.1
MIPPPRSSTPSTSSSSAATSSSATTCASTSPVAVVPALSQLYARIVSLIGITLFLGTLYAGPDSSKLFFWHPFFAILGVLPLGTSGIFINMHNHKLKGAYKGQVNSGSDGAPGSSDVLNKYLFFPNIWHNVLMLCAVVAMLVSFGAIYTNKERMGKPHFTSIHGKVGLMVVVGYTLIAATSVVLLWGYPQKLPSSRVVAFLKIRLGIVMRSIASLHRVAGKLCYVASLGVMALGWWAIHAGAKWDSSDATFFENVSVLAPKYLGTVLFALPVFPLISAGISDSVKRR